MAKTGPSAMRAGDVGVGYENGSRAVGDLTGITDGHATIAAIEDRLELAQRFHRLIRAWPVVARHRLEFPSGVHGDDLFVKAARILRGDCFLMASQRVFILI